MALERAGDPSGGLLVVQVMADCEKDNGARDAINVYLQVIPVDAES